MQKLLTAPLILGLAYSTIGTSPARVARAAAERQLSNGEMAGVRGQGGYACNTPVCGGTNYCTNNDPSAGKTSNHLYFAGKACGAVQDNETCSAPGGVVCTEIDYYDVLNCPANGYVTSSVLHYLPARCS